MPARTPRPGDLEPIETASRDEIAALQLERMRWSLHHAYDNVACHKKAFDEKGVHPDDLKTLADLARFPFMTKTDLRDSYPFGLFAVPRNQVARLHASSGTTGKSVVVGYTHRDLDHWADVVARAFRRIGKITGRSDDMLIIRGVNVFPTQIEEQILRDRRPAGTYQIVVTRDGHMDNVEVRCELQREISGRTAQSEIQSIAKELQHRIKTIIGISTRITVMEHEAIPRTLTGKARRVLDERPKRD